MTDIDPVRGKKAARKWKTRYYPDAISLLENDLDIVVIATPDDTHAALLELVVRHNPRYVICEKPVATDARSFERIKKVMARSKVPVEINFSRRFDGTARKVRSELMSGKHGKIISAHGIYTKGVVHAHFVDWARFFLGEMIKGKAISAVRDHEGIEPSVFGYATFERCPRFSISVGDERRYSIFELDIMTERKRFRFVNFGFDLIVESVVSDPVFKGYRTLGRPRAQKTDLLSALPNLYAHALRTIEGKERPWSSFEDAARTHETSLRLLDSLKKI
jgi:predicted dehydrogenase